MVDSRIIENRKDCRFFSEKLVSIFDNSISESSSKWYISDTGEDTDACGHKTLKLCRTFTAVWKQVTSELGSGYITVISDTNVHAFQMSLSANSGQTYHIRFESTNGIQNTVAIVIVIVAQCCGIFQCIASDFRIVIMHIQQYCTTKQ